MIALLVFAILSVLTIGFMLVAAANPLFREPNLLRGKAEEKGLALLTAWLSPEQAEQWTSRREFEVIGCDTGTRYRITTKEGGMNIRELDGRGRPVACWCFGPVGPLVTGDVLLAQKIALETMEGHARSVANRQSLV
jgi:hypothetical protein